MLSTQLHITTAAQLASRVSPVENRLHVKPLNGFWTSTYNTDENTSAWVDWCHSEDFGNPDACNWFLLAPSPKAKIYTIDTLEDLKVLAANYTNPATPAFMTMFTYLDFERIARDFDAINLTDHGQWVTRHGTPSLYGWDCESTLWFNWKFDAVSRIK